MRKLTTEEFIERAKKTHGDKYDYSQTEYVNKKTKLKIICPEHGEFWQVAGEHLRGSGCKKCAIDKQTFTTDQFIERAKEVHGDKYDYSLVKYKSMRESVEIICPRHGKFTFKANYFLKGNGCPICNGYFPQNTEQFVKRAREIHGDKYDYFQTELETVHQNIKIICPIHGEFIQRPNSHLNGVGCRKCSKEKEKIGRQRFIERAREVHGDKYDYSLVKYEASRKVVKIICPIHGIFEQIPYLHVNRKSGCPICNESQGEKKVRIFLEKNNIDYEYQKTFENCKNKRLLFFDFYLPKYNYLIEFDGEQHYGLIEFWKDSYIKTKINDEIKNKFAEENNIDLLRIPYWEIDNIEEILKKPLI